MPWLSILDHAMLYLVKINEAVAEPLILPYAQITLVLATLPPNRCFSLTFGNASRQVRGFKALFKLFRLEIYRRASLQPRPSDLDFTGMSTQEAITSTTALIDQEAKAADGTSGEVKAIEAPIVPKITAEEFIDSTKSKFAVDLECLTGLLSNQDILQPLQCQTIAANSMCQVMMALQRDITSRGGSIESLKGAFIFLFRTVAIEVDQILPPSMSDFIKFLDKAQVDGHSDRIDSSLLAKIKLSGFNHDKFKVYRTRLFAYLVSNLGQQMFPLAVSPLAGKVQVPYLPTMGRIICDELLIKVESINLITDLEGWINSGNLTDVAVKFADELWTIIDASGGAETSFKFAFIFISNSE